MVPNVEDKLRERAYRCYQAGDSVMAERICRELLEHQPRSAEAFYLLGVIALDAGQLDEAARSIGQAASLAPDNAVFPNALGELHLTLGRHSEARACFQHAIACRPTYDRAHNNLGRLLHALGHLPAALASFTEAVRLNPKYATAHNNLGAALQTQGQLDAAEAHFRCALAVHPDYPEAHFNLGTALQAHGDPVAAAEHYREAIRLRPTYVRAHFHLGQVLEQQRRDYDALACYQTAAHLAPRNAEIQRRLGDLLMLKKDWPEALAALETAVALEPGEVSPFARLVWARQQVCDWRHYDEDVERLWVDAQQQVAADEVTALVPFQALTMPWPRARLLAIADSHSRSIARRHRAVDRTLDGQLPQTRTGRLRIGYLSGDFYDHPISHLLYGLFGRHARDQFEVFAYSFGPPNQSVYRRRIVAECEHFVEVGELSTADLARRIAADKIHVLVDLMGYTGTNRINSLALHPAPIQVSFLGMLGTMGAEFIDYLITDRTVTPPEFAAEFTEQFVTMPHCYLIAEPEIMIPPLPADRTVYGLPATGFVYCSFNGTYKIEPRTFSIWMRILAQVPDSVLWLYSTGEVYEHNLRREATARGVASNRLVFAPFLPRAEHLARHRAADLFLDTLLYNAAATASLALQMGLPVLTCLGATFASRVGASLLHAAGLPELIASDLRQYEERAILLARQPDELRQLSAKLLRQRSAAPLFDTPRFVRNLERAYLAMWENYASGRSPCQIEVVEPSLDQ